MNTQPEALQLADYLTACPTLAAVAAHEAAAELRRLYAVNTELLEALERIANVKPDQLDHSIDVAIIQRCAFVACAAIIKATGEQA